MTHPPYDEEFKKSLVSLHQNGKSLSKLSKEYGVSLSALIKWVKQYSEVKTEDGDILTARQIKEKRSKEYLIGILKKPYQILKHLIQLMLKPFPLLGEKTRQVILIISSL